MYFWWKNLSSIATIVMLFSLIFIAKPHDAMRPLGGTKSIKYGAKALLSHTPIPPSAPNSCTYIPNPPPHNGRCRHK
ncbi:hypothetical protein FCV25MIE_30246 [Fagus crenata]